MPERIFNPITAMGFSAMFTFQLDNTKRHPITIMGVVDTFGLRLLIFFLNSRMARRKNSANTNIKTSFLNQMHFLLSNILVIGNTAIHHRKPKGFHLYLQVFVWKLKCFELNIAFWKSAKEKQNLCQSWYCTSEITYHD